MLFETLFGFFLFVMTIYLILEEHKNKFSTVLFLIFTTMIFCHIGSMNSIGDPMTLKGLETNTVYRVYSQCPTENNGFIITVKAPNDSFKLIKHKERLPAPLFVIKQSLWQGKETIEEFTAGN